MGVVIVEPVPDMVNARRRMTNLVPVAPALTDLVIVDNGRPAAVAAGANPALAARIMAALVVVPPANNPRPVRRRINKSVQPVIRLFDKQLHAPSEVIRPR